MAGAGYKLFNTGDVLTAAQVNTYLQEQVVMVFANAAARTTALSGVLAEGMVSYLKDTDALEIYSGSAWVGYGSGDITGVTAGTGISGGGTSGTVTITNAMATEITAAGDIIVGTGSGTFDNLPIGTTGQVLTADTTVSPYKIKWATAGGGGKILQVVYADTTTETANSTSTYADTSLSASITPSSATSKVMVLVSQTSMQKSADNALNRFDLRLLRGATALVTQRDLGYTGVADRDTQTSSFVYLDSPSTTSSTTYKTQFMNPNNTASVTVQGSNGRSSIILCEVGA